MTDKLPKAHKWQFTQRFRRSAFGWRSDAPIQRIKEAVSEIKRVARSDEVLAAEGAVKFLEKLSPALENVDSSSGAIGNAVNRAIETLALIIARAQVDTDTRQEWLERLWQAIQDDGIPYIERLSDEWDKLCVTTQTAAMWADKFIGLVKRSWSARPGAYFPGTTICLASLYAAGQYDRLLELLDRAPFKFWPYHSWGVKALLAMGKKAEALDYAQDSAGLSDPFGLIAQTCEDILLSSGLSDEAYRRYAHEANLGSTNLATFRAIVKKYPHIAPETILLDLVAASNEPGKWFAAAKDAGLYDQAIELANASPTDPRTLTRAARDYAKREPAFALAAGQAALHWIAQGYGYEITALDAMDAGRATLHAAECAGVDAEPIRERVRWIAARFGYVELPGTHRQ
ncbi:MAG: hypothetical protein LBE59_10615 [Nevskiaceae bacterium]|nr:hypothetical protein [Nevskiaceae bacterium]